MNSLFRVSGFGIVVVCLSIPICGDETDSAGAATARKYVSAALNYESEGQNDYRNILLREARNVARSLPRQIGSPAVSDMMVAGEPSTKHRAALVRTTASSCTATSAIDVRTRSRDMLT